MRAVVITGVSTGIGYAATQLFTSKGIKVFGSVRKLEDAKRLQKECGPLYIPLIFDVRDEEKIKNSAQFVREQLNGHTLWALINNAGIFVSGAMINLPLQNLQKQLDVNVLGQLLVTQAFVPLLGADEKLIGQPGKIINMGSMAGKNAYPFMCAYSISKHAMEAFSEGLRRELMIFGIDVIMVAPGSIDTNIWDKADQEPMSSEIQNSVYKEPATEFKNFLIKNAKKEALPAQKVAALLFKILKAKHPKVRYSLVPNKFSSFLLSHLPKRWIDKIIANRFGLIKNK